MIEWKRAFDAAAAAVFGVMIALPLLTFHREEGRISLLENKTAAEKPVITAENRFTRELTEAFDAYFTDRIGLRDEATLLQIGAMYRIFGRLEIPDYQVGSEQHVFYMIPEILRTYQGLDCVPEERTRALAGQLELLNDSVCSAGRQFVFMPIPNKERIYGEYMPDDIHVISERSMLSDLADYVKANTEVPAADVEHTLLQHKNDGQLLYYRNIDASHWNHYGMFWGYQALMDPICARDPLVRRVEPDAVLINREETHSAFAFLQQYETVAKTFSDLSDFQYTIVPSGGWHAVKDNSTPRCVFSDDVQNRYFHYHNDCLADGKTLFVYGDSYIWTFMLPMLGESFTDVYFVAAGCGAQETANVLSAANPDVVVLETVARMVTHGRLEELTVNLRRAWELYTESLRVERLPLAAGKQPAFRFDRPSANDSQRISISENRTGSGIQITGWAMDFEENMPTGGVLFQVGGTLYPAERMERMDLGEAARGAGFQICIPEALLQGVSEIEAVALTADGRARIPGTALQIAP